MKSNLRRMLNAIIEGDTESADSFLHYYLVEKSRKAVNNEPDDFDNDDYDEDEDYSEGDE